jgi:hypothetical protein
MSISFNLLGRHGRLGNQMFQYAMIRSIASYHDYHFLIPDSEFKNSWTDHQLFEGFKLPTLNKNNIGFSQINRGIAERYFHYDDNFIKYCPDNLDIRGYFQCEKYFLNIENLIRSEFAFTDPIRISAESQLKDSTISLHIRRGDYVGCPHHDNCCPLDYYDRALSNFKNDTKVIIFTDDPVWLKSQEIFKNTRFNISENNSNLVDMCMMTLCENHIIANSSFSWWGAWLSNSKLTIAPKKWFGPAGPKIWKDIYCSKWLVI